MERDEEFCPNCGSNDICYHCNSCDMDYQNGVQVDASLTPLYANECKELREENKQLKQQLHDLPKQIVGEIKDKVPEIGGMKCEIIINDFLTLNTLLDTISKKYGGENE